MSVATMCDHCERVIRGPRPGWSRVSRDDTLLDFCSDECVADYFLQPNEQEAQPATPREGFEQFSHQLGILRQFSRGRWHYRAAAGRDQWCQHRHRLETAAIDCYRRKRRKYLAA